MMLINTKTKELVHDAAFRHRFPNTSFPKKLTDSALESFGHAVYNYTPPPVYDSETQELSSAPQLVDGKWQQVWAVTPIVRSPEEEAARLERKRADKIAQINVETSAAILAGFNYEVDGTMYRFSYGSVDQRNFADAAVMCSLSHARPVEWGMYDLATGKRIRHTFTPDAFLVLYAEGSQAHKRACLAKGEERKAAVMEAETLETLQTV